MARNDRDSSVQDASEANVHEEAEDDLHAYIERGQRQLLTPGWEEFFEPSRFLGWLEGNVARLTEQATALGATEPDSVVRELLDSARASHSGRRFQSPHSDAIFRPLLDQVRAAAGARGLATVREIHVASSTDVSASPVSLPSVGEHLLFIGSGTSAFCNYWAKVYTAVVTSISAHSSGRIGGHADLQDALRKDPSGLVLAARLALYEAFVGTTLGFGEVTQPSAMAHYRLELLRAMELFAVAHEFGHFVAEERLPWAQGQLTHEDQHRLETFCDEVALALSRDCSGPNYLAFCGIGAVVFLRSAEVSAATRSAIEARRKLTGEKESARSAQGSHPSFDERVTAIKTWIAQRTESTQVNQAVAFLTEFDLIATLLNAEVLKAIDTALALKT